MTVTVSPKYQVVIPKEVRDTMHITPGMRVSVISKGGIAYIVPVPELKTVRGMVKSLPTKNLRDKKDRSL